MALNVNWNWRMPTVGNANEVAKTNQDYFMQGMDAIGQGILKGGENKREDAKQKWLEDTDARNYAEKVRQFNATNKLQSDKLMYDQLNTNRNYMLQRDIFNQNKKRSDFDMGRLSKQDEWLQKFYEQYFGNTPDEIERIKLIEELKSLPGWQELL